MPVNPDHRDDERPPARSTGVEEGPLPDWRASDAFVTIFALRGGLDRGRTGMREGAILRLFVFRPARSEAAFDATLREDVLPRLMLMPGIVDAFVGRHGPGSDDERVIASIWE